VIRVKLAEALALRSDQQKKLAQITHQIATAASYQEDSEPPESATDLLAQAHETIAGLETLIRAINRTNSATELAPGMTLTDAIARRDALGLHRTVTADAAERATGGRMGLYRQLRSELRTVTDLPVAELRHQADRYAGQRRELDVRIQQANWATDLLEDDE
jgi:hypothetical protein